jgi:hypothetical protein
MVALLIYLYTYTIPIIDFDNHIAIQMHCIRCHTYASARRDRRFDPRNIYWFANYDFIILITILVRAC